MPNCQSTICDVLRLLRIANDLSIKQLSDKTGISVSYITEIEKGLRTKPTIDIIDKYSKALNVNKSTIMFFQESFENEKYTYQDMLLKMLQKMLNR